MIRLGALALVAAGCAASRPAPVSVVAPASAPRAGTCVLATERGLSNPAPGVACVPPRQQTPMQAAFAHYERGDYPGAADCYVAAWETAADRVELAYRAAEMYLRGGRRSLAREYYARFLALAPDDAHAPEARRQLAMIGADSP